MHAFVASLALIIAVAALLIALGVPMAPVLLGLGVVVVVSVPMAVLGHLAGSHRSSSGR